MLGIVRCVENGFHLLLISISVPKLLYKFYVQNDRCHASLIAHLIYVIFKDP